MRGRECWARSILTRLLRWPILHTHEGRFAAKRCRDRLDDSLSNGTVPSRILGYDRPDYRSRHEQVASWSSAIGDDDGKEHQDIDHTMYRNKDAGVAEFIPVEMVHESALIP